MKCFRVVSYFNSDLNSSIIIKIEAILDKDLFEISNTIPTKHLISTGYQKFLLRGS